MKVYIRLIILFGILTSSTAYSTQQQWTAIARITTTSVMYVDWNTLKVKDGGIRRLWNLRDMGKGIDGGTLVSMRALTEFDCKNDSIKEIQMTGFDGPMGTGHSGPITAKAPPQWYYPAPTDSMYEILKIVCSHSVR